MSVCTGLDIKQNNRVCKRNLPDFDLRFAYHTKSPLSLHCKKKKKKLCWKATWQMSYICFHLISFCIEFVYTKLHLIVNVVILINILKSVTDFKPLFVCMFSLITNEEISIFLNPILHPYQIKVHQRVLTKEDHEQYIVSVISQTAASKLNCLISVHIFLRIKSWKVELTSLLVTFDLIIAY
jgi:hypothetical protein